MHNEAWVLLASSGDLSLLQANSIDKSCSVLPFTPALWRLSLAHTAAGLVLSMLLIACAARVPWCAVLCCAVCCRRRAQQMILMPSCLSQRITTRWVGLDACAGVHAGQNRLVPYNEFNVKLQLILSSLLSSIQLHSLACLQDMVYAANNTKHSSTAMCAAAGPTCRLTCGIEHWSIPVHDLYSCCYNLPLGYPKQAP